MNNKRILAFDCGDRWIGTAHTDESKTFVYPYKTWEKKNIIIELNNYLKAYSIECIVLGLPITMKGNISAQTNKVIEFKTFLEENYSEIKIFTQDERLSSSFAKNIQIQNNSSKNKEKEHAISAAIILENFILNYSKK